MRMILWLTAGFFLSQVPMGEAAKKSQVQHEKVLVRIAPQPFAKAAFELSFQAKVEVQETKGAWLHIRELKTNQTGWAPAGAFKKPSFILGSSTGGVGSADKTEMITGGKGFNASTESSLKIQNADFHLEHWTP